QRHGRQVVELIPGRAAIKRAAHRLDPDQGRTEVARPLPARDHKGRASINRDVAVVQDEGSRDDPGAQVLLEAKGLAIDRLWVVRRVAPCIQCDPCKLLAGGSILVKVPLRHHRDPVGRRRRTEGQGPLHGTTGAKRAAPACADSCTGTPSLSGGLPYGPKTKNVVREASGHRHAGIDHGSELPRELDAAAVPVEIEPQRVLHVDYPCAGKARRARDHSSRVRGEAVNIGAGQPGIIYRLETGINRKGQRVAAEASPDLRLAEARDRCPALKDLHQSAGSNSGIHTGSWFSKTTRTGMPIFTCSIGQFTRFVVRRRPGCSTSSTTAITNGVAMPGYQGW